MSFSPEWEERFKESTHISNWPWSDLVSYVMRYANPNDRPFKILELGCGSGANIPFFLSLKTVKFFGIDGSASIIPLLQKKFPSIENNLVVGDFTQNIPFEGDFDLIVDRAAMTSNSTKAIESCLDLIYEKLKPGGQYIGIDLYSTANSEYKKGDIAEDNFTKTNFLDGPFVGIGRVHFFDKYQLLKLFEKFEILRLEHKTTKFEIPATDNIFATWNILAKKKLRN